jgi:aspartate dehydrogenase
VAIASLGAVGGAVARRLDQGIDGLILTAVSARDRQCATDRIADFRNPVPVLPLEELATVADVIVECAPAAVFARLARSVLSAGKTFMPITVSALLENWELVEFARTHGARIIVPSGALLGLDAVQAAAEGHIESVRMITRKPPAGLAGAPYLVEQRIDLTGLNQPLKVFAGNAREGAHHFPANVNVAAVLGLAGIGPDRTQLEIWADPTVTRNTHHVVVDAGSACFDLKIENVPSAGNPRTGKIVALSIIVALRKLVSPLCIGT